MPEFNNLRNRVAVVGVGTTAYGSFPETDEYGLAAEAFRNALAIASSTKARSTGCSPAGFRVTAGSGKS